jgi:predicted nucleotidyltransferase
MISQIFDTGSFKVLALFALSPGSRFRRKEIKEKTRMHNVTLDNALSRLLSSGIIRKEKSLYFVNLENPHAEQIIAIVSSYHKQLKNLPLDVYFLLVDAVDEFSTTKGLEVWLFGSYSKMIYSEKSDIDIALLVPQEFDKERVRKMFKKMEKQYGKKIEEHFFDARSFYRSKRDPLVKEILQNGVRII